MIKMRSVRKKEGREEDGAPGRKHPSEAASVWAGRARKFPEDELQWTEPSQARHDLRS